MENYLVKLLVIAALLQIGISLSDLPKILLQPQKGNALTRAVLKIDWRPISVFPGEGKRFK